jgi:transcriptional regulator with XRE-family HTH domain
MSTQKPAPTSTSTVEIHGYALRVIREARGRKVAELAQSLDVDRSYIARIETGNARRVSTVFYTRLLAELQIEDFRALLAVAPVRAA